MRFLEPSWMENKHLNWWLEVCWAARCTRTVGTFFSWSECCLCLDQSSGAGSQPVQSGSKQSLLPSRSPGSSRRRERFKDHWHDHPIPEHLQRLPRPQVRLLSANLSREINCYLPACDVWGPYSPWNVDAAMIKRQIPINSFCSSQSLYEEAATAQCPESDAEELCCLPQVAELAMVAALH